MRKISKAIDLSDEELKLITKMREEKQNSYEALEAKFKAEKVKFDNKVQVLINKAKQQLILAEQLSEEAGIPFRSDISCTAYGRAYVPKTFYKTWPDGNYGEKLLTFMEIYDPEIGWEYWNSSSVHC